MQAALKITQSKDSIMMWCLSGSCGCNWVKERNRGRKRRNEKGAVSDAWSCVKKTALRVLQPLSSSQDVEEDTQL